MFKLSFYKCVHFLLFLLLSTLWIYQFHCFPILFLLLYLSFHLDSVHHHPDFPHISISTQIPDQDFKKIVTSVQKRTLRFAITANPGYQISAYIIWDFISDTTKKNYLKVPKTYNLLSISINWVDEVLLKLYVK